jgi:hypothetical protein
MQSKFVVAGVALDDESPARLWSDNDQCRQFASEVSPVAHGVQIVVIAGFSPAGEPLVQDIAGSKVAHIASTIVDVGMTHIGRRAVVQFEDGDRNKPIILGLVREPVDRQSHDTPRIEVDGNRLVITASHEIVLRCGDASVTLTKAGKVLIRGAYVSTRSSGVNRIRGGSVQIN